ncbi:hypothetical protein, partial [Pseudomonas sp. AH2 (2023)]|uniref:hypothetical protein n=1 Tax=Pseudomonas sp. AH2 (2023) TaxID=3048599 RepID=UPI002B23D13F
APAHAGTLPATPLLQHFGSDQTQVAPGHNDLMLDVDGALIVATGEVVLRFDGVGWSLTPLPRRAAARAVAPGDDGLVYV